MSSSPPETSSIALQDETASPKQEQHPTTERPWQYAHQWLRNLKAQREKMRAEEIGKMFPDHPVAVRKDYEAYSEKLIQQLKALPAEERLQEYLQHFDRLATNQGTLVDHGSLFAATSNQVMEVLGTSALDGAKKCVTAFLERNSKNSIERLFNIMVYGQHYLAIDNDAFENPLVISPTQENAFAYLATQVIFQHLPHARGQASYNSVSDSINIAIWGLMYNMFDDTPQGNSHKKWLDTYRRYASSYVDSIACLDYLTPEKQADEAESLVSPRLKTLQSFWNTVFASYLTSVVRKEDATSPLSAQTSGIANNTLGTDPRSIFPRTNEVRTFQRRANNSIQQSSQTAEPFLTQKYLVLQQQLFSKLQQLLAQYNPEQQVTPLPMLRKLFTKEKSMLVFTALTQLGSQPVTPSLLARSAQQVRDIVGEKVLQHICGGQFNQLAPAEQISLVFYCCFVNNGTLFQHELQAISHFENTVLPALKTTTDVKTQVPDFQHYQATIDSITDADYAQAQQHAQKFLNHPPPETKILVMGSEELEAILQERVALLQSILQKEFGDLNQYAGISNYRIKSYTENWRVLSKQINIMQAIKIATALILSPAFLNPPLYSAEQTVFGAVYIAACATLLYVLGNPPNIREAAFTNNIRDAVRLLRKETYTIPGGSTDSTPQPNNYAEWAIKDKKELGRGLKKPIVTSIINAIFIGSLAIGATSILGPQETKMRVVRAVQEKMSQLPLPDLSSYLEKLPNWKWHTQFGEPSNSSIGNTERPPRLGTPRFVTFGVTAPLFWSEALCDMTTTSPELKCHIQQEQPAHLPVITKNNLAEIKTELQLMTEHMGFIGRINTDGSTEYAIPAGYHPSYVIVSPSGGVETSYTTTGKVRVVPENSSTTVAVLYEKNQPDLQDPPSQDSPTPSTRPHSDQTQDFISDEHWNKHHNPKLKALKDQGELYRAQGIPTKDILEFWQKSLQDMGVEYGFSEFSVNDTDTPEMMFARLFQEDEDGKLIHPKWICNQFSFVLYILAKEIGLDVHLNTGFAQDPSSNLAGYESQGHMIVSYYDEHGTLQDFEATLPAQGETGIPTPPEQQVDYLTQLENTREWQDKALIGILALLGVGATAEGTFRTYRATESKRRRKKLEQLHTTRDSITQKHAQDMQRISELITELEKIDPQVLRELFYLLGVVSGKRYLLYAENQEEITHKTPLGEKLDPIGSQPDKKPTQTPKSTASQTPAPTSQNSGGTTEEPNKNHAPQTPPAPPTQTEILNEIAKNYLTHASQPELGKALSNKEQKQQALTTFLTSLSQVGQHDSQLNDLQNQAAQLEHTPKVTRKETLKRLGAGIISILRGKPKPPAISEVEQNRQRILKNLEAVSQTLGALQTSLLHPPTPEHTDASNQPENNSEKITSTGKNIYAWQIGDSAPPASQYDGEKMKSAIQAVTLICKFLQK